MSTKALERMIRRGSRSPDVTLEDVNTAIVELEAIRKAAENITAFADVRCGSDRIEERTAVMEAESLLAAISEESWS